jgi:cationic amino acid transporter 4
MTSSRGKCEDFAIKTWKSLTRTKTLEADLMKTPLKRCLSALHLAFFGIGQMAGAGVYVLTGTVAKTRAGPATFLSYFIAGVIAFLSALCYAEFGARVPKAGSSYTYAYVTVGEFLAFVIGWNILLEHCIGAASTARAWGGSVDAISNGAVKNFTITYIGGMNTSGLADYPDFLALAIIVLLSIFVALGAKVSMNFNSFIAVLNMAITVLIVGVGFYNADISNWTNKDHGGFLPFGFGGVISGAAMCFYGYVGFDGIAIAGEEAENPAKAIPIANGIAMSVVMIMYVLMSSALTLMVPYYNIDPSAAFAVAFRDLGFEWAEILVTVAALVAITGTTLGNLYAVPRSAWAMASDGLLFDFLTYVHPTRKTPMFAILVFSILAGTLAVILDLETLAEFVSLGTLMAVTVVSACVIVLRYQGIDDCQFKIKVEDADVDTQDKDAESDKTRLTATQFGETFGRLKPQFKDLPILNTFAPGKWVTLSVAIMAALMFAIAILIIAGMPELLNASWWLILILVILCLTLVLTFGTIVLHVQNESFLTFQVGFRFVFEHQYVGCP